MFASVEPSAARVLDALLCVIEENQHPYGMPSFFYGLSHGLKIARQLSIFTPVCALVPPFRVPMN